MPRQQRVLSFMSQWGVQLKTHLDESSSPLSLLHTKSPNSGVSSSSAVNLEHLDRSSPSGKSRADTAPSPRPVSTLPTYQPPTMEVTETTPPELQPIFAFLGSQSNKLYQEGYFLKLHDLDARGRPSNERHWVECFAQLVGTVLSLWDGAALDAAGAEGEVIPTFINLADASIKMIGSLPMNGQSAEKLSHVLSISTAGSNRYLLHFNSLNSLTQWTSGIRLAMYEHATLQEAYTGSLIAGKGRKLNNIRVIMDRSRAKHEDWARVRFGAGTPWRRCWCVVSPPDEKEVAKAEKSNKKRGLYDRPAHTLKGDIKFYDTKKITKRTLPLATIKDAYSAYAIYPESKPLIDQSTLVKIEGVITIHSNPESVTEGFVFVMPEMHPAVSGFEMMVRFLFPVFDTFGLYGRPGKLVADVIDPRGLMFAMPNSRRYGYLDILDVAGLIHTDGSNKWSERQWRKELKDLTAKRMKSAPARDDSISSRSASQKATSRTSLPPPRHSAIRFNDQSTHSQPSSRKTSPPPRQDTDSPSNGEPALMLSPPNASRHQRSVSEANGLKQYQTQPQPHYGGAMDDNRVSPLAPPGHSARDGYGPGREDGYFTAGGMPAELGGTAVTTPPPAPVAAPPAFAHHPSQRPLTEPYQDPDLRRANSHIDEETLSQIADSNASPLAESVSAAGFAAAWGSGERSVNNDGTDYNTNRGEPSQGGIHSDTNNRAPYGSNDYFTGATANRSGQQPKRLPTIPASPYIGQPEPSPPAQSRMAPPQHAFDPARDPRSEHSIYVTPPVDPPAQFAFPVQQEKRGSLTSNNSQSRISRKPVPGRSSSMSQADGSSAAGSDEGSLRNYAVNNDALIDRLDDEELQRANSMASSNYDNDSVATPDYASTKSSSPKHSMDRPRYGVLRTVGTAAAESKEPVAIGDTQYGGQTAKSDANPVIPTIDFGPTYAMNPENRPRPGTGGTITQGSNDASSSGRTTPYQTLGGGPPSPGQTNHRRAQSSSPHSDHQFVQDAGADHRRSLAWTPGMGRPLSNVSHRQSFNADEWVQQRAAQASQPYLPVRTSPTPGQPHSRPNSGTPPMSRNSSGDWTSRPTSRTPEPGRPHSRGASTYLQQPPGGLINSDKAHHLSAREQEYVSRVTGTPLISGARTTKDKNGTVEGPGLIGAIAAREKERKDIKEGRSGAMVHAAIAATSAARQQELMREQMRAQQEQQRRHQQAAAMAAYSGAGMGGSPSYQPQGMMGYPGGMPQQQYQQQQQPSPYQQFPPQQQAPQQLQPQYYQPPGGYYQQQQQTPPQQPYGASYFQGQGQGQGRQR